MPGCRLSARALLRCSPDRCKSTADGRARVELDIPDFEGQLRIMAVAYNRDAVGRGEAKLVCATR